MARMAVGSFQIGTGAATTTINVATTDQFGAVTPQVVLFWWNGQDSGTDAVAGGNIRSGIGFAYSTSNRGACAAVDTDAATSAQADHGLNDDACIVSMSNAGTGAVDGLADLNAIGATAAGGSPGFQLIIDDQFPADMTIFYAAIGGSDVTVGAPQLLLCPAATGNQDVTVTGFEASPAAPDQAVILLQSPETNAPQVVGTDSRIGIGFVAGTSPVNVQWCGGSNDGDATMQAVSSCRTGESLVMLNGNTTGINSQASVSAWLTDGFRIAWTAVIANRRFWAIPIKGGRWAAGDFTTSTSNGGTVAETGLGFAPHAALFLSHGATATTSGAVTADDRLSFGAADGTSTQICSAYLSADDAADAVCVLSIQYGAIYSRVNSSDAEDGNASVQSFDSDGFTILQNDGDAVGSHVVYLAVGGDTISTGSGGSSSPAQATAGKGASIATGFGATASPAQATAGVGASIATGKGGSSAAAQVTSGAGGAVASGSGGSSSAAQETGGKGAGFGLATGSGGSTAAAQVTGGKGVSVATGSGGSSSAAQASSGKGVSVATGSGGSSSPAQVTSGKGGSVATGSGGSVAPAQVTSGYNPGGSPTGSGGGLSRRRLPPNREY